MSFLIIGLPRSRTAWVANFMTYDGIYCHHEAIDGCHTLSEYKAKIGNDGDAGTGLMLFDISAHFPDRRLLIIESSKEKAADFMYSKYGHYDPKWMDLLEDRLNRLDGLHVHADEINDRLEEIWSFLTDKPFDPKRGDMLKTLNVQTHCYDVDMDAAEAISSEFQTA